MPFALLMQVGRNTASASDDVLATWDIVASTPASSEQQRDHDIFYSIHLDGAMTYGSAMYVCNAEPR